MLLVALASCAIVTVMVTWTPRTLPPAPLVAESQERVVPTTHRAAITIPVERRTVPRPPAQEPPPLDAATPIQIRGWVEALRDDGVRFNAIGAVNKLRRAGRLAKRALEDGLRSHDTQQRTLSARLLRDLDDPPDVLLTEESVEQLRQGRRPRLLKHTQHSMQYLARHASHARQRLHWGLGSDDPQQRFFCAYLLGQAGYDDPVARRILVDHLGDNRIQGDALMASHALYKIGPRALPTVRSVLATTRDAQAATLLRVIERDLVDPAAAGTPVADAAAIRAITTVYHDPVHEYRLGRSRIATW